MKIYVATAYCFVATAVTLIIHCFEMAISKLLTLNYLWEVTCC